MAEPDWLDDTEKTAWWGLLVLSRRLFEQLDRELEEAHGLSLGDYEVLVVLEEAPDDRLRMSELADWLMHSRSRLTHHVGRLERDGLVRREQCPDDRRGTFAVLTDEGRRRLVEAALTHLEGVRRHLFDKLTDRQTADLSRLLRRAAEGLELPPFGPLGGDVGADAG
ncbi:MAG: MarR family transcriptional regulator [Acidimicrobiia bacterium]|nr:MarR family transcriptional regulator [Acidimicrobiia bacterium]